MHNYIRTSSRNQKSSAHYQKPFHSHQSQRDHISCFWLQGARNLDFGQMDPKLWSVMRRRWSWLPRSQIPRTATLPLLPGCIKAPTGPHICHKPLDLAALNQSLHSRCPRVWTVLYPPDVEVKDNGICFWSRRCWTPYISWLNDHKRKIGAMSFITGDLRNSPHCCPCPHFLLLPKLTPLHLNCLLFSLPAYLVSFWGGNLLQMMSRRSSSKDPGLSIINFQNLNQIKYPFVFCFNLFESILVIKDGNGVILILDIFDVIVSENTCLQFAIFLIHFHSNWPQFMCYVFGGV